MINRRKLSLAYLIFGLLLRPIATANAGTPDMAAINAMDRDAFVQKFGGIFEKSPWVGEKAWEEKPFASLDEMHAAMFAVAKYAPASAQLNLLHSHPDLAGREAQAGTKTASSLAEQASAGLSSLSHEEMTQISDLNAACQKKFGFPFIIAVRMRTKEGMLFEFTRRLQNDAQTEFANDLQNVYVITRLRLNKLLEAS